MATIEWNGETLTLEISTYKAPKNKGIQLYDEEHMPYARATLNPDFLLPENHVAIKNYSENEGVLEALIKAGVIEETGEYVQAGFENAPICRLLITA
ncbi:MAG: hypothetical protein HS103_06340 [Anaerolineales bacterium]|nr:hypothetical protein [Anaerolineales bacterium]